MQFTDEKIQKDREIWEWIKANRERIAALPEMTPELLERLCAERKVSVSASAPIFVGEVADDS